MEGGVRGSVGRKCGASLPQVFRDLRAADQSRKLARATRTQRRANQHLGKAFVSQCYRQCFRLLFAFWQEWDVGSAGVATVLAPFRCTVAQEPNFSFVVHSTAESSTKGSVLNVSK
jgi:hypothetical protein